VIYKSLYFVSIQAAFGAPKANKQDLNKICFITLFPYPGIKIAA